MRRSPIVFTAFAILSCSMSSGERGSPDAVDALLARPGVAAHLAVVTPSARPLLIDRLSVELTSDADGATKLSRRDGASMTVQALDVHGAGRAVRLGVVVREAAPSTELFLLRSADVFEEVRVLRDERASARARYHLRAGSGVAGFRIRRGVVEAHAESGETIFATTIPFAVDAHGVERPLQISLDGDVLTTSLDTVGLSYPIVVDPTWTAAGTMNRCFGMVPSRALVTTTGPERVIAVGASLSEGCIISGSGSWYSASEVWASSTNTWAAGPTVSAAAASTMVGDKLLVAGDATASTAARLVDLATGETAVAALPEARKLARATTLADGRVLLVGGQNASSATMNSALTYSAGAWSAAGSMATPRFWPVVTTLGNSALVAFGYNGSTRQGTAELWTAGTFTSAGTVSTTHESTIVALSATQALAFGGVSFNYPSTPATDAVQLYTAGSGWTARAPMPTARDAGAALTVSGRVVVAGGRTWSSGGFDTPLSTVEVFDAARNVWLTASPLSVRRARASVVGLSAGRVLIIGGRNAHTSTALSEYNSTAELFTPQPLGTSCSNAGDCASGACEGSVCCDTVGCTGTKTCTAAGKIGTCVSTDAQPCTSSSTCSSGSCVDGYCCNTPCTGQCEACDVSGNQGTCTPVAGAPRGSRSPCTSEAGNVCSAAQCDGTDRTTCKAFVGSGQSCRAASCTDGIYTSPANCDGTGKCPAAITNTCDGFTCADDGKQCRTTCSSDSECMSGFACKTGKCTKKSATCSEDRLVSRSTEGLEKQCAPYFCDPSGDCATTCKESSECQTGFVCDLSAKQCVPAPAATEESGGCAQGRRTRAAGGIVAFAAVGLALLRRRRR